MAFLNFGKSDIPPEMRILSRRYEAIIRMLREAVVVYDKSFKLIQFNNAAEKVFNLKAAEVVGQVFTPNRASESKYTMLVQALFPSLAPTVVNKSELGVFPQVVEVSFSNPYVYLRIATTPLESDHGDLFVKIVNDITREVELKRAKSEFINLASHRLKTPLTSIGWALEIVRADKAIVGESREAIEQGSDSFRKLSKILDDLLDVSKIEEGQLGYSLSGGDLIPFLEELVSNAKEYVADAGLKLKIGFQSDLEKVALSFDSIRLGAAISNILDNAIRYNVENGEINIKVEALKDKSYIQVSVADTGIGIPAENMADVSDKFFRAKNAQKAVAEGLGLGLFVAKNIIKRHGGSLRVESVIDRGTTVYFTLPTDLKLVPTKEFAYQD